MNADGRECTRTLIYFPIIHTQTDLGSFGESLQRATLRNLSVKAWRHKLREVENMWTQIEGVLDGLHLSYDKVRLYQDGLPVCGREAQLVTELAKKGSRNHSLLLRLMKDGAVIMGTESPEHLREEYKLLKQATAPPRAAQSAGSHKMSADSLIESRNRYIADRINNTLLSGETGILFLGMLHSLEGLLDPDIRVIYPLTRPFH